jgi:hypothetical protein
MNAMLLNTGVIVFILYAIVSIVYQVSAYRAAVALRQFIQQSSGDLQTTLAEFRAMLENFRKISDNVTMVTQNVREITSSVVDLQHEVKTLYGIIKDETRADLAGLKAGIMTGVATLVKSQQEERSDEDERRT